MTWLEADKIAELQKKYGDSAKHNYSIIDAIPTPHPYCITPQHLKHNPHSVYLGKEQIEEMESTRGGMCGTPNCQLKYGDHKQALLIQCKLPMSQKGEGKKFNAELHKWLKEIKDEATKDGYDGFAFVDENGKGSK